MTAVAELKHTSDEVMIATRLSASKTEAGFGFARFTTQPARGIFNVTCPCSDLGVNKNSVVVASVCEFNPNRQVPFMGLADTACLNVVPHDGGNVVVKVDLRWGSAITGMISLMVVS